MFTSRPKSQGPWVIAISGASGMVYAVSLLRSMLFQDISLDIVISDDAFLVMQKELGLDLQPSDSKSLIFTKLLTHKHPLLPDMDDSRINSYQQKYSNLDSSQSLQLFRNKEMAARIASGSFQTQGMVIAPASLTTLGKLAHGICDNLIVRAAEVHLKERRPLIVVPRETPLSLTALRNLTSLSEAGAVILPAMPGFYHQPQTMVDLVHFIVGKIFNAMGLEQNFLKAWQGE